MSIGREEVFGPVLCIKRVDSYEQGLQIMNDSRFANGSVIYTQSGYYARKFAKEMNGGMVGINVGIPVPGRGIFGSRARSSRSLAICTPWAPTACAFSPS